MATRGQLQQLSWHRQACQAIGVPRALLHHKHLKGSISATNAQGNQKYTGPGPVTSFTQQYSATYSVWWVQQPFTRGEQRQQDEPLGVQDTELTQSQCPAIQDDGTLIKIEGDDFIEDADGQLWVVQNPVLSPDRGYYTFMTSRMR